MSGNRPTATGSWLVARRLRDDEPHLGPPGSWSVVPEAMSEFEALNRTRYFEEALGSRALAADLDSLETYLTRHHPNTDFRETA